MAGNVLVAQCQGMHAVVKYVAHGVYRRDRLSTPYHRRCYERESVGRACCGSSAVAPLDTGDNRRRLSSAERLSRLGLLSHRLRTISTIERSRRDCLHGGWPKFSNGTTSMFFCQLHFSKSLSEHTIKRIYTELMTHYDI